MTVTYADKTTLTYKATLDEESQLAIEAATHAVENTLLSRGFKALGDDRLATLEAAIVRYFFHSQIPDDKE